MPPPSRIAVYYAPAREDPLWQAGAGWLGRDPETNAALPQPDLPGIAELTAEAGRYGFHATLKPPMRLRGGTSWHALRDAAARLAASLAPFALPKLVLAEPHGFLALRESAPCPPLRSLADACIEALDDFRDPPTASELAHRRRNGLAPEEDAMLRRWGYPYAFGTWFFHMTLTRRLTAAERAAVRPLLAAHVEPALGLPRLVANICLFTQAAPDRPFVLAERLRLGGSTG